MARVSTIYDPKKERYLTATEVKNFIASTFGWGEDYKKKYDIFKNKLRTQESFLKSQGLFEESESAVEVLYYEAKRKAKAEKRGQTYAPSFKFERIQKFSSYSSGAKSQQKALGSSKAIQAKRARYEQEEKAVWYPFVFGPHANPKAREIWDNVTDPFLRHQALVEFAKKKDEHESNLRKANRSARASGVPFMEVNPTGVKTQQSWGSDNYSDFDYSAWLSE